MFAYKTIHIVCIGCTNMTFEKFREIILQPTKKREATIKRYFNAFHQKHDDKVLRTQEIQALIKHHSKIYPQFLELFETLIQSDKLDKLNNTRILNV
ncbi:hypothetical protein BKH41_00745 [Helicobacter sp. 12S02232-10]|uniref:hypothetical protein n=1 Tax=Helicobacter sp. 12S02232-10 TaxID=1476197 RepID=UPI000BA68B97|nr:hypothetical protein [Helicobacter sp. 12S02232-10]PAF49863.1 hypothetical protein BKH41_00745 [Helicobacter sp. 12S02232-10]